MLRINGKSSQVRNSLLKCAALAALTAGALYAGSGRASAATAWYASGSNHTLVLKADGSVWAVGKNNYGQLGNGTTNWWKTQEPQQVKGINEVVAVAAGGGHSVALKKDGTVWGWGYNGAGQLGQGCGGNSSVPVQVLGLSHIKAIAAGQSHVVALKDDGTVWSLGNNRIGQLGDGSKEKSRVPVMASGLHDVVAIAAGGFHTMALKADGTVWSWGYSAQGALGTGRVADSGTGVPTLVSGLSGIKSIAAGLHHSVALAKDGRAYAWGSNEASQLGENGTVTASARPVAVAGIDNVVDITAKANHTIALREDGSVWAWGDKGAGEWGNGNSMSGSDVPVRMHGVSGATKVAAVVNPSTVTAPSANFLARLQEQESGTALAKEDTTVKGDLVAMFLGSIEAK
ncbi:hypothetical protein L4X63_03900 [Geomonas sp. Red32]|uniref:RCC1 domain-containing protein n=1 Tax=Geomonas sp. Red32 TaxID=2912856 RepID=UPI00202CFAA6|nr:hypothetical protein [Geomonas sp. Red32]MCM0080728.1 hypothetical protein [Geomonas sp. Red32]